MRSDLEHNRAREVNHHSILFGVDDTVLSGDYTLVPEAPVANFFDPNGANRVVILPAFKRGRAYVIAHNGSDHTLTVQDSGAATVVTIRPGEIYWLVCSGNEWRANADVFGPAGVGHSTGLVPDPGAVAGLNRFLMDDGTWTSVTTAGIVDAYKQITDGSNTSVAAGLSQFKLRSSDSSLTILVTEADATHGDNADFAVNEAAVDHDQLLNFVANEHIDHTAVSINTAANSGLAGGGTIAASRNLTLDVNNLTADTPVLADEFAFHDVGAGDTNKATLSALNAILDHDALLGFVANEHIDHSGVSITAGAGLSGGGTITTTRTISLDITGQDAQTPAAADEIIYWSVSGLDFDKCTFTVLNGILDHDLLLGFVANEHIDHTAVTLTAGAGLTGGGDISSSRSFDVGAGTGITVNANDVALDTSHVRNVDHSAVTLTAGAGLTGGGTIESSRTFDVGAGTGITVNANDVALDTAHARNVDHSGVTLTAGAGLTGGGDISASRSFAVGAGTGITVNADDVAVNQDFSPTWTGDHTFDDLIDINEELRISGILTPAQITSTQNNYAPTGHASANVFRLSSDASRSITGLAGGTAGRVVTFLNVDANDITLEDEDAGSTDTNRFALDSDLVIAADCGAVLWYDPTSSRWRLMAKAVAGGVGGGAPTTSQYLTLATDGTLTNERVLTPGSGLTGTDGGAGSTYTLAVGAGIGIAVNADDVALNINGLTEDTTPDVSADFVATYDASATTHKKVLLNKIGVTDAQYITLATHASLSAERTLAAGDGLTGTDGGAGNAYTLAVGAGDGIAVAADAVACDFAVASDQETATSLVKVVNPGIQHRHPSAIKAACRFNASGTIAHNYNITNITDSGTGDWSINIATDFSAAGVSAGTLSGGYNDANTDAMFYNLDVATAAGVYSVAGFGDSSTNTTRRDPDTPNEIHFIAVGDQ